MTQSQRIFGCARAGRRGFRPFVRYLFVRKAAAQDERMPCERVLRFRPIERTQLLLEKSIKMTPAETARALFYFSAHNNARPTPVGDAAKHIHLPHAREYQGQTPPRS